MRQIAATRRRDRLLQQIASCDVKIIVAAIEFRHCDLSHEFKLVWIRATYRSDKISASSLVAPCVRIWEKSLRQNLNQPMRKHQLVSLHVKFEIVYISSLSKSITCTEQVSYRSDLSQDQCRWGDLSPRCVTAICRIVCLGLIAHIRESPSGNKHPYDLRTGRCPFCYCTLGPGCSKAG